MRYISKLQVDQYPVGSKPTVNLHLTGNTSKRLSKCPQALISTHTPSHTNFLVLHFDLLCAAIHHILALLIEYPQPVVPTAMTIARQLLIYHPACSSLSRYLSSLCYLSTNLKDLTACLTCGHDNSLQPTAMTIAHHLQIVHWRYMISRRRLSCTWNKHWSLQKWLHSFVLSLGSNEALHCTLCLSGAQHSKHDECPD